MPSFPIATAVPRSLMSQAGSPPCLGKPVGLHSEVLPSSFCHLQSVISDCLAGSPRPLQPQPMSLLCRAIYQWDSDCNGETADNGQPVTTPPPTTAPLFSRVPAFFSQDPAVTTSHATPPPGLHGFFPNIPYSFHSFLL